MRIGLFGGSFDPIHVGHLILAQAMLELGPVDRVRFVPAGRPPHKSGCFSSGEDRLAMVREATRLQPRFEISETELRRDAPSFTIDTVKAMRAANPEEELLLVLGQDSAEGLAGWYRAAELLELCRVLVAARPGHDVETLAALPLAQGQREMVCAGLRRTPLIEISATEIRRRRSEGRSIAYLVTEGVEQYIVKRGLYRENLGSGR